MNGASHANQTNTAFDQDSPPTARTIAVLEYLAARRDGAPVADIVEHVGLSRSACRAILAALERSGYVSRDADGRSYRVGAAAVALGRAAREHDPLLRVVSGVIERLKEELDVGFSITARSGDELLIVERIGSPSHFADSQHSSVRLPYAAPFGSGFAAHAPQAEIDAWLDRSGANAAERAGMVEMLDAIRRDGYFVQPISARGQLDLLNVIDDIARTGHMSSERARHAALLSDLISSNPAHRDTADAHYPGSTILFPVMGADRRPALATVLHIVRNGLDTAYLNALGERVRSIMVSASAVVYA
jgi:DNA-binding IclR family transcriptional regulator